MQVYLSRTAEADLDSIKNYLLENAGLEITRQVIQRIIKRYTSLQFMPERHRIRTELAPEIRCTRCAPYYIFYRIKYDEVEIARILHEAQEISEETL